VLGNAGDSSRRVDRCASCKSRNYFAGVLGFLELPSTECTATIVDLRLIGVTVAFGKAAGDQHLLLDLLGNFRIL